jgi:hypothetical protein
MQNPMSEIEFSKKLSTSIQEIDIKLIEKEFENYLDDLNNNKSKNSEIVLRLMRYE